MKKEIRFTLIADGTPHSFDPHRLVACPYERKKITQLNFYRNYVAFRDSPHVYILDNGGIVFPVTKN